MSIPTIALTCALLACATGFGEVINGGAETGDMTGWRHTTGVTAVTEHQQQSGTVRPFEGDYFFSMAGRGTYQTMIQLGTFDQAVTGELLLRGYMQTEFDDWAVARLGLEDGAGNVVADSYSPVLMSPALTWMPFSVRASVNTPLTSWWVEFYGQGGPRERDTNVYFDAVSLNVVPEPAGPSWCLTFVMAFCVGSGRRRVAAARG